MTALPRYHAVLLVAMLATGCATHRVAHTDDRAASAPGGAVAVPETHAADVAIAILRRGGNAVDAAIATQFALAVTFPSAGNIGGGGFMLVAEPGGAVAALDYRETAPATAHPDLYLDAAGEVVEGASLWSHRAAGVPGTVMGMWEAHRRFGSLPWADLVAPAIDLAKNGFLLDQWTARSFHDHAALLDLNPPQYRAGASFRTHFHGAEGDRFRQPELAATLERIAARGPDGFYGGETARLIVAEMGRGNGLLTLDDLAGYRAVWREPVSGTYRGHRIVSMPPPSSGGIALIQMLNMLEGFELPPMHSPAHVHLIAEIEKRAFADRAEHLGDPDRYPVPTAGLTAKGYARARVASVSPDRRTDPGTVAAGHPPPPESEETTHFSIVDRTGLAVANTTTLNASYGSGWVVTGAGLLLNNEMDDFSAKPGVPNLYGVVGATANRIEAGKRMLSSMAPTFVFRPDGKLYLALGSPGGPTIFTTVLQVIVNRIDYGLDLAAAVAAPRFHHQWPPPTPTTDPIRLETDPLRSLPTVTRDRLEGLGYELQSRGNIGAVHAIEWADGHVIAVADPRAVGGVRYE